MPLKIVRNDITKMQVDAIVNAANGTLLGDGGVDGAIHRAAGPRLLEQCRRLGGCQTGSAKVTRGYDLPCKYIIHTVGPVWQGGGHGEQALLESCYRTSLELARRRWCRSIAIPLISSGAYGYPKDQALQVAVSAITRFLETSDMTVYLVVFDKSAYQISEGLYSGIRSYIDDRYASLYEVVRPEFRQPPMPMDTFCQAYASDREAEADWDMEPCPPAAREKAGAPLQRPRFSGRAGLKEALQDIDESFSEMLLRKITEKGIKDSQCYKKANISRKLFSKIRSDRLYRPSKPTVLAFAIALELSLEETRDMLQKAGFALSHSSEFDIIVEYFIRNGNYDIFEINMALFEFDQSLLGG